MAQKPETVFKKRIRPRLKALPKTWGEKINQVSEIGTPDFLMCINSRFVALELKKDANEWLDPKGLQYLKCRRILKAGGYVYRVYPDNFEAIYKILLGMSRGKFPRKKNNKLVK